MTKRETGIFIRSSAVAGESYNAYVPHPLPPAPPLDLPSLLPLNDQATAALGRLDGMSMLLPDTSFFLYMYVRKEAVLSSQIEGTQSSLSDLLLFESDLAPGVPLDDAAEVSCYVAAMTYGLERMRELPLSLRLIREIHARLMNNARGGDKLPGEFRKSQNWVGGSRPGNAHFVPPPPEQLQQCLGDLEKFIHDDSAGLPALIKAALIHVQFETIHPFLDGNGRLGRLLITLLLCHSGLMKEPLLYLSLYFKTNRQAYYDHLQAVRTTGDWESWVSFFLTGVIETAAQATDTARRTLALFQADREKIEASGKAMAGTSLAIHAYLQRHMVAGTTELKAACNDISLPTILRHLANLEKIGIIREITGKERNKRYLYKPYLDLLAAGTEPLRP